MRCARMIERGMLPIKRCGKPAELLATRPPIRHLGTVGHIYACTAGHRTVVWVKPAAPSLEEATG